MQTNKLLPLLMQKDFYSQYSDLADSSIFPAELQDLPKVIEKAHEVTEGDVTPSEVRELYNTMVPIDSKRRKELVYEVLDNSLKNDDNVSPEMYAECARLLREQKLAKHIALECSLVSNSRS